ncbi:MAG: AAA family ATPase, partial [Pseudonocardiales bacterium]
MSTDPVFAAFCAARLWPGVGPVLAAAMADAGITGPDDVTATNLAALPKIGPTRAGRLLSAFLAAAPAYEVAEMLVPADVDARVAGRVVDALGPPAPRLLRDDPWQLLAIYGITPADADRVARLAIPGVRRDDPRRGRALVGYVLTRIARDGHTVAPREDVLIALGEFGAGDAQAAVAAALEAAIVIEVSLGGDSPAGDSPAGPAPAGHARAGHAPAGHAPIGRGSPPPTAEGTLVAGDLLGLARFAEAEDGIAQGLARLVATAEPIDADPKRSAAGPLDAAQRAAVAAALRSGVSVLTGGPGTGKSRTVAAIVSLAEHAGHSVALAAPTGRAAKRLEELCEAPASTIHRLLGAQARQSGENVTFDGGFARGEDWPLDEDVVVVDEASMLDVELADALLSACKDGTHLVFVGDAAQLPSIGAGRVLGDLIDSGTVPVTELNTLYRQAEGGSIARLAIAVRGGDLPPVDDPTREVVIVAARGSLEAAHRVSQLVTDSIPRALGIPADQVQVVTPVHRGAAGTLALNAALKAKLNPGTGKRRFDVGDRVVATANHMEATPFGYANGEVGVVDEVEHDGTVTVEFASGPAEVKGK